MELTVIRHTRLEIDADRCYGQSEVELASSFADELASLQARLSPPYCKVISSPLQRCVQLASQFSDAIETDAGLLEYNFGDWELTRWNEIDQAALDQWMQDFVGLSTPNGESLLQMQARVAGFIEQLRKRDYERCLIVTHAGVIRCIWAHFLKIPLNEIFKLKIGYGEILRCQLANDPQADVIFTSAQTQPV